MPVYEFECVDCGHQFDQILTVTEFEEEERRGFVCPECQGRKVEQLIHGLSVQTSKKS